MKINRDKLKAELKKETATYEGTHKESQKLFAQAKNVCCWDKPTIGSVCGLEIFRFM